MSREACEKYAARKHKKTSVVISIRSTWDKVLPKIVANATNNIQDVLFVAFNDVDGEILRHEIDPGFITKSDAIKIAHFVNDHKFDVDLLIVHCDGGVSRSPGVLAAAKRYLTGDDLSIFKSQTKCPNTGVYLAVIKAFEDEFGWSIQLYMDE